MTDEKTDENAATREKTHSASPFAKAVSIVDKSLLKIEETLLSYGIISLAVLVVGSVISRTVFNRSWIFMEEVANAIMILITFLGLGYCVRKARHIRMSAIHDMMPKPVRKVLILIVCLGTGLVMAILGYWAFLYAGQVYRAGNVTPALRVPQFWITVWVPVGFAFAAVEYFMAIYKNLRSAEVYLSIDVQDVYEDESLMSLESGIDECEVGK